MKRLKIGLVQANFRSAFRETVPEIARIARNRPTMGREDFEFNQRLLISLARQAVAEGAELLVSSESYLDGWSADCDTVKRVATTIPGPETDNLCAIAAELGMWMCIGLFEKKGSKLFNSAALLSSDGQVRGVYRKTHETKQVLAKMPYDLGDELPVFETPWGVVGILVCHDRWYPEAARALRQKGAKLILNPVAAGIFSPYHMYHDIHTCVLRTQAYTNGLFWASCNCANHGGHSLVIAPDGSVIAEAAAGQEVLIADLDPAEHGRYDFVSNVRQGLYNV